MIVNKTPNLQIQFKKFSAFSKFYLLISILVFSNTICAIDKRQQDIFVDMSGVKDLPQLTNKASVVLSLHLCEEKKLEHYILYCSGKVSFLLVFSKKGIFHENRDFVHSIYQNIYLMSHSFSYLYPAFLLGNEKLRCSSAFLWTVYWKT